MYVFYCYLRQACINNCTSDPKDYSQYILRKITATVSTKEPELTLLLKKPTKITTKLTGRIFHCKTHDGVNEATKLTPRRKPICRQSFKE